MRVYDIITLIHSIYRLYQSELSVLGNKLNNKPKTDNIKWGL